jgi:uncharacterized protein YcbK (DUF882 family)
LASIGYLSIRAILKLGFVVRTIFELSRVARSFAMSMLSVAIALTTSIGLSQPASAGAFLTDSPKHIVAVHDFGEEHAFLGESIYDKMDAVTLAALPRGVAHIAYLAPSNCVPSGLKAVLAQVSKKFGPITVNSTFRSTGKNRNIGGKEHSMHLSCRAVDFRVHGNSAGLMQWLAANHSVGGYNRYPAGFYHIDNGPKRTW